MFLASYTFNSQYRPNGPDTHSRPSLRLLEGGRFLPEEFSPVLVDEFGQTRLRFFRWGFVPAWARGEERKARTFADVDHLFEYTPYQLALSQRRCLIPADGFYVGKNSPPQAGSQMLKLARQDGQNFCFAGIYTTNRLKDGSETCCFAILTAAAPARFHSLGLRMPLILPRQAESLWLNPHSSLGALRRLFLQNDTQALHLMPVIELQENPLPESIAA
ncbi:MAG: hypothetical protein D6730_07195 [Bacteroidetes bacterium]|nr:MAG: hypothetical protein D6730_07195 [Bacteroidota bacterium]